MLSPVLPLSILPVRHRWIQVIVRMLFHLFIEVGFSRRADDREVTSAETLFHEIEKVYSIISLRPEHST